MISNLLNFPYRIAKEAKKGSIGKRAVMPHLGEAK